MASPHGAGSDTEAEAGSGAPSVLRPFAIAHAPPPRTLRGSARLALNASYFDTLLSLIPAKYYASAADGGDEAAEGGPGTDGESKYYRVRAPAPVVRGDDGGGARR